METYLSEIHQQFASHAEAPWSGRDSQIYTRDDHIWVLLIGNMSLSLAL